MASPEKIDSITFQAGDEGAVVSEFSTRSRDESDIFNDLEIQRAPQVVD